MSTSSASSSHYHIVGSTGDPAVRLEIDDFVKDEAMLNIYLLALAKIQAMDQKELTSYYQISGIHGLPYIPWDGVVGTQTGYCSHFNNLFPTWHRVYLRLLEQVFQNEAKTLAEQYTDPAVKAQYLKAAERFRHPYWDWTAKPKLPNALVQDKVKVYPPPLATAAEIDNPLQAYKFHPLDASFPDRFSVWPSTLRAPGTMAHPQATDKSSPDTVNATFAKNADQLRGLTFKALTHTHTWSEMASGTGSFDSIEMLHALIHINIGGDGHMAFIPLSSFDPIFYYHHTNVDRQFAIWQALNPGSKVTPGTVTEASATLPKGATVDENTELAPFHIDDNTAWTSAKTYSTKDLGYTYPEIPLDITDPQTLKSYVYQEVMKLYGPQTSVAPAQQHLFALNAAAPPTARANLGSGIKAVTDHVTYKEWTATASLKPFEFPSSGYIHIFLSPAHTTASTSDWLTHDDQVGTIPLFVNNSPMCGNCVRNAEVGITIHGQVFLTDDLVKRGCNVNDVVATEKYLKDHLHWRCSLVTGEEIPLSSIPSLEVKVQSSIVNLPAVQPGKIEFPSREALQVHGDVTQGKAGGFSALSK